MAYKVTSGPAVEPVTRDEAKNWLKLSSTSDDSIVDMLIESARQVLEDRLNLKFITQTVEMRLDSFPVSPEIALEFYPVQSITSVSIKTASGSAIFSTDAYTLDTTSQPARLYLNEGYSWPTTKDEPEAVTITAVTGYGDTAADVPAKLKKLMLHAIGFEYEHRMNPVQERRTYIDKLVYLLRNWSFE